MTPTRIEPYSPTEMLLEWTDGARFAIPYVDLRYYCPCAACVDEHTGERVIQRSSIGPDIRPTDVQLVGRYAIRILWTEGPDNHHVTGMYHFDSLRALCERIGRGI